MLEEGASVSQIDRALVDDVIAQSEEIEERGLERYAADEGVPVEQCFQTLVTGLAVRYYKALTG